MSSSTTIRAVLSHSLEGLLFQPNFLVGALKAVREHHINTALDTSGYAPLDVLKKVEPLADVFLYDLKRLGK